MSEVGLPAEDTAEAILDASPDAMLLVDAAGRITYASDRVTDLFGYEPGDLLGEPVEVLVPEAARDAHAEDRAAYTADPERRPMAVGLELFGRRTDGSKVPVDIALSPIDVGGESHVLAVVRDVGDREALRTKYRTILQAVPDAVVVADATTGEIVEANEQVNDLLGYEPEELVGRPQTALHPVGEAERYRALFDDHVESEERIYTQLPDGSPIHVERRDGERVPVEINAHVFDLGDQRLIAGVFRDVTLREERERQLKALHETTRRLMEADDRDEIAGVIAEAASEILGYSGNVVRFVVDGTRLVPVAVTEQARSRLGSRPEYSLDGDNPGAAAFESGEPLRYDDVREIEDGYDRGEVRSAIYLPMGRHGMISVVDEAVGAFDRSDVELASILAADAETALNRLEYERELRRQNERLDEFARVVSHDLRNPLGVARGWLEYVDSPGDERQRIADALDRMDAIIEDTLTLAREGRTVAEVEAIDATDVAVECWAMVSTPAAELSIVDEFRLLADRDRLRHVFENLFRNAIEHGGDDGGGDGRGDREVDARGEQEADVASDPGVTITVGRLGGVDGFYVEDDGRGIPPDEREAAFDPGRSTQPDGTGFGLTIVRQVAEAHGWDVRVTEGTDGGARFEFTGVEFA